MNRIQEKIRMTCETLYQISRKRLFDIPGMEYVHSDYKQGNQPPAEGWQPVIPGRYFRGKDEHCWFRTHFRTPEKKENVSYYAAYTDELERTSEVGWPQSIVYLNGKMMQGCDEFHPDIYLEPDTDYDYVNYCYINHEGGWFPLQLSMFELDEATEQLYYDMQVAYETLKLLRENTDEYVAILGALEQTANRIDFRDPGSESFRASVEAARAYINEELYGRLCNPDKKPVIDCVGSTHIDVEWQWNRAQTREKIQRSFSNVKTLMDRYPEFRFLLSQPENYRYLREEAPEKYEELKQLVKEGRWEPEGAMYVEADCNLPSGESFVRQIIQGKKFFRDEFGVDSKILFLPDVFGYSAALPQILKKSGVRHFITSKISWNDTNLVPVDCFLWEGLDGSEIFTNFITSEEYEGYEAKWETNYNGSLIPTEILGAWNRFQQKGYTTHGLTTYGFGDGGGGPTKNMLEYQRRLSKGLPGIPATRIDTLLHHLDTVREEFDEACEKTHRTPRWVGELYLEFHRGTYTSIGKVKRGNRKSEFLLQKTEALSATDLMLGGSYDAEGIYHAWTKVLHNQFHDIIPGSSIKSVYEGTDVDYQQISGYCDGVIAEKLAALAARINTEGGVFVYNSLGFPRRGMITVDGRTVETAEEIPAFGWKVLRPAEQKAEVQVDGLQAENKYYRMELDAAGRVKTLLDKTAGRQVLKSGCCGNEIQAFEDYPYEYDNWEIKDYYKAKMWRLDEAAEITPVVDGSRAGFRVVKPYMHSTIVQNIWLYSDSRRIDFETEIDWHEHHQLLKAAFPLDVHANSAAYEIQFGHVERTTHENTGWDKAQFEVYGHKWVDLSENGYGIALLNDCKYGFNTEGSTLKLTMLKCGTHPNPEADQGIHRFTYSLLPHAGGFREGNVIREAYALNQPLNSAPISAHTGDLPESYGLISCNRENVVVETVKKAEADDGLVVRMYEAFDERTTATLGIPEQYTRATLCDLMENPIQTLEIRNHSVELEISNFEIVTVKLEK